MKKKMIGAVAAVLTVIALFGGVFLWQYLNRRTTFKSDGYMIASEEQTDTVVCNYFTSGSAYSKTYGDEIMFVSSMGTKERMRTRSFIHYTDTSLSSLQAAMLADLDEAESGVLDFYYLAPKMVLTGTENTYAIDNNGTNLEFRNFLYLLDEGKFMVQSGGGMTLKLASGASHELESGYLEITYPEDRIVQIYNEESLWQSIADGCLLVLDNGVTIDLGNKTILDSQGNTKFTIDDVAMDLASGSGIAVQSDSDVNWEPPVFEFDVIDGSDGVNGENGVEGVAGTNGEEGSGGEAGEDKEDGEDGEEGEEGEEGDEGDDGDDGRTGNAGTNGTKGQSGTKGTSGTSGDNGQQGADGSNGGTAGGGGGGSGSMGNGIGHIVISELEYDCSEVTFSFYADDAEALQPGNDYVEIIDLATNTVRRIDAEKPGDNNTSLNRDIVDTDKENPIELTVQGLNADTEYQIVIYSSYSVMNAENVASGTKAFATRTFYTASEGVTMAVTSRSQSSVTISLERKNFSKVEKARVYLTFEGSNGQGSSVIKTLWKDVTFGNSGKGEVTFDAIEDGESLVGGLTSNIPFYATLYTGPDEASLWTHSNGEDDETTLIPDGALLENRKVIKSNQKLDGRTLKATPNFGEVAFFKNSNGSYQIYLDGVADPDNATENYVYKIYAFDEDKSEKVLVRTLSTITNSGVELFVDEDGGSGTVKFNGDYIVECEASYYDNEKNYTALLSGTLKTGSGESIVWFMPADKPDTFPWSLPDYVKGQGAVGPTWMYGYLVIDGSKTAFSIDKAKDITVQVSSGDDYTVSMLFSGWDDTEVKITDIQQFDPGTEMAKESKGLRVYYGDDQNILFLPVNLWGLKAGSYYTFTVSATVEYSDALKAVRGVGTTIVKSGDYNKSDIDKDKDTPSNQLHFRIDDIHTTVPDYGKLAFAIKLEDDWKDSGNYPIEVLSARAIEVAISDKNHQLIDTHIFDLYEEYTVDPEDEMVWCTDKSPLMQYFKRSETEKEEPLLIYKTDMFNGSVDAYDGRMYFEITNVYDYTYKNPSAPQYFQTVSASNRNFKNNLAFDGKEAFSDIGREKPKLIDPPTDGVAFQPILNKVDVSPEKGEVSINQVLGSGSCDPGLDGDVVRGYCLQANYKSSEIDAITYYLFTYDDWRYFSKCIVESAHGVNNNLEDRNDIVRASLLAEEDENKDQPIEFWKDKVLKIELKQKEFEDPYKWYTEAPNIAVIYDPNAEGENGYVMEKGINDWIIIRTNFLSRGRTYIASFSVMDGYGERDENGNATYWYPFDDLEYPRSNLSLFRSHPMKMNRQAPQVKMLLNKTDLAGDQEWEFYVYDPDQALGRIQLGSENEKDYDQFCNKFTTWDDKREKEPNVKWREGYIMASTYSSNTGIPCAIKSYAADYKTGTAAFPEVEEVGSEWKDSLEEPELSKKLTSIFSDYEARGTQDDVNLNAKGKMWYGKFKLGMGGNPAGKYYLFLGRSLNDSMYLTTPKDNTAGGEGRTKSDLTLYTMAASTYAYQTTISDAEVKTNAKFTVTNDKNNLSFSFDSQASNEKKRAVALEVTIWQNKKPTAAPGDEDYDILVSEIIACDPESNGVAASETFGDLDNLVTNTQAYATARIIYDTGLYGTAQGSDGITDGDTTVTLKKGGQEETISLWKNKRESINTYSLRRQAAETWYSGGGAAIGAAANKITNSLWKINTSTFHGLNDTSPATANMTILHGESDNDKKVNEAYKPVGLALTSQYAKGDDYISEDDMLQHAVSGWNYGTTGSIVFGRLGVTDVVFNAYTANEKPIDSTVTLNRQGKDPIVLNPYEAVGFILGQPEIAISRDSDTTVTPYLNKAEVKFRLEEASKNRIREGKDYLPYVFIEVYEGTKIVNYKQEGTHTLVEDLAYSDSSKEPYRNSPASIYNELWGAAAGECGSVFQNVAAIHIGDEYIPKGTMTQFMLSNLKILNEANVTYSVKLYVLPTRDSDGNPIEYSTMANTSDFAQYKQPIRDYSYDKNKGKGFYCSNVVGDEKGAWWKLPTIVPPAMKTVNITYTPNGYEDKKLNISQITEFTSNLTKDAYLEAQLLDGQGNIILTNKQIKELAGYDQANSRTFEYYDGDGQKQIRYFADYGGTGNNYYVNGGMNINIIDEINSDTNVSNKLRPGETYTIQMRLCYMDPTLALLNPDYFEKKPGGSWFAEGDRSTVSGKESRTDFDVHLTKEKYKNPIAEGTVAIAIGEAIVPFAIGDFGDMSSDGKGQDMTIRLRVTDVSYTLGAFKKVTSPEGSTKAELVRGEFYVKVFDYNKPNTALDVTDKFPGFATYLDAKKGILEGTWPGNPNFRHSYYVEYWGTTNGISHKKSGLCGCGKRHAAGEVDEYGNERLWSSEGDSYYDANLTMPDISGIKIDTITGKCTASGSDTLVEIRIMGSGYRVLEGSTCRIDISTNSGLVRIPSVTVHISKKTVGTQEVVYFTTAGISAADKALLQSWGTASVSIEFTYQGGKKYTIAGGFSY